MLKTEVLDRIESHRLIALTPAHSADHLLELGQVLQAAGITHWELPLSCPAIPDYITAAAPQLENLSFGLGTVIDTETTRRAILAGVRFISTPAPRPEVILLCRRHHVPVICGVHSPEHIEAALAAGADALKLYPSRDRFGPTLVRETRERFPDARLYPVGGVNTQNVADFIAAGANAVFVASGLGFTVNDQGQARSHRDFDLTSQARELIAAAAL